MSNQIPETEPAVTTPPPETTATVQQAEPIIRGLENYPEAVQEIAHDYRILDRFSRHIEHNGWVVGEQDVVRLCYLAMTSRVLERPVSLAVKGPSSGGKSHVTGQVLRFFPDSAYYALTAMSEKALIYSEEDLRHRFLVLYEAESLKGDMASYLIRSLLSEGRIRYETVISSNTGLSPQMIEREGPTGLLITTTATSLHSENETRFLSVTVQDTPEQTMAILLSMASDESSDMDLSDWTGFQEWIDEAEHRVVIPFAAQIAALSNPAATRLRRDFKLLLNLIKTHAILHQFNRERDDEGRIVAELDDYAVVHELVSHVISAEIGATVSETIRETANAVAEAVETW